MFYSHLLVANIILDAQFFNVKKRPWNSIPFTACKDMTYQNSIILFQYYEYTFTFLLRSSKTPYAKKNGGKYDFIVENRYALPQDEDFWTDMFAVSQNWGIMNYMQVGYPYNINLEVFPATYVVIHIKQTYHMCYSYVPKNPMYLIEKN